MSSSSNPRTILPTHKNTFFKKMKTHDVPSMREIDLYHRRPTVNKPLYVGVDVNLNRMKSLLHSLVSKLLQESFTQMD